MDRSGIASSTREIAGELWGGRLPKRNPALLVRELYEAENQGKREPSGSQDMIGLVYPGVNRLDYDFKANGGVFPSHIESLVEHRIAKWVEKVVHLLPVAPRPDGYNPLGQKNLNPKSISRLGQTGKDCFESIRSMDLIGLGASLNACMKFWEMLLPQTVRHPRLSVDLMKVLRAYQRDYPGAMYSGCGGGYLIVVSERAVPGSLKFKVRLHN
jgi:hypothetical protein